MISHKEAADLTREGYRRRFGAEPTRPVRQLAQAVGWLETSYAQGWDSRGRGSNNVGAEQANSRWTGPTFAYVDTSPNADGTSTPYRQAFKVFASLQDGFTSMVGTVYSGGVAPGRAKLVLPAAQAGDAHAFSAGLYDTVYYQGFGRDRDERIGHHEKAVRNACALMAREIGEPMPDGSDPPPVIPVLRLGSYGPIVAAVQRLVGARDDGVFGPATAEALRAWQRARKLKPDGVWGPVCFHVAETEIPGELVDDLLGLLK